MNHSKIEVRRCEPDDYQAIQEIFRQPKAIWGTLQVPYPSIEAWKKRTAEQEDSLYWLVASVENTVVGSLGLSLFPRSPRRRHVGELGMAVHDQWQQQGIGSALVEAAIDLADQWLNLRRLELTVYTDNAPAIKLYKRVGFENEGTLRRFAYRDGDFADAYLMARLR